MRQRVILAGLLTGALLAGAASAQTGQKHFLWKVEGPKGGVAYLLGSMHVLTPDFYPLAPEIEKAFAASTTLVEEVDIDELSDPVQMMGALAKAMLTDGRTLDQLIAPATFAEVKRRAEQAGLPLVALQRMKPWLAAITLMAPELQAAGFRPELGIDQHFFTRAKKSGMKRQALETIAYQLDRFDEMPMKLQEEMLKTTLADLDTQAGNIATLAKAWADGDIKGLEVLMLGAFLETPEMYERLLVERNRNWVPHVDACLQQNAACFIVVGAAHLVGPDGLPTLLTKKGYKVTQQ